MIWWMALAAHATDSDDINLCGDEGTRVVVLPSASPPTRTRATFTLVDGCGDEESPLGASTFVEWDPLLDGVVARSVTLAEGEWRMTLWSEPRTLGSSSSRDDDISWHLKNVRAESHDRYEATVLTGVARWSPDSSTPMEETILDLRVTQKVSLEAAVGQFGQAVADGAPVEGLRSTSSAFDSIATRATSVAGEIVIERARSQSFEAVREQLQTLVCDKLTWPRPAEADSEDKSEGKSSHDEPRPTRLFSSTCDAVKALRLEQLATQGDVLLDAALQDIIRLGLSVLTDQVGADLTHYQATVHRIVGAAVHGLIRGHGAETASQILVALADDIGDDDEVSYEDVVFATIASCHGRGGCDARAIRAALSDPKALFHGAEDLDKCDITEAWPDVDRFVSDALAVLSPPVGATAEDQLATVSELAFALAETRIVLGLRQENSLCSRPKGSVAGTQPAPEDQSSSEGGHLTDAERGKLNTAAPVERFVDANPRFGSKEQSGGVQEEYAKLELLRIVEKIFSAAIREDLATATWALGELALNTLASEGEAFATAQDRYRLRRFTHVLGAFVEFGELARAQHADTSLDDEARRAAQKEALMAMVEAHGNRSDRKGQWAAGIGGELRGALFSNALDTNADGKLDPTAEGSFVRASLPLGVSIDRVPRKSYRPGIHIGLQALDLGEAVVVEELVSGDDPLQALTLDQVLRPGLTGGLTLGRPNAPLLLGGNIAFPIEDSPVFSLVVGVQVPLVDLL